MSYAIHLYLTLKHSFLITENLFTLEENVLNKLSEIKMLNENVLNENAWKMEVIQYIAGFLVKKLKNVINCSYCSELLESKFNHSEHDLSLISKKKHRRVAISISRFIPIMQNHRKFHLFPDANKTYLDGKYIFSNSGKSVALCNRI